MPDYADIIKRLPEHEQPHVRELAENVLFMRYKLEETRSWLKGEDITIPYDNGGGQSGIRANPAYGEYERLLKAYTNTLGELRELLGEYARKPAKPVNVTSMVGNSKWAKGRAVNE